MTAVASTMRDPQSDSKGVALNSAVMPALVFPIVQILDRQISIFRCGVEMPLAMMVYTDYRQLYVKDLPHFRVDRGSCSILSRPHRFSSCTDGHALT